MIDLNQGPCVAKRLSGCGSGTEYLAVTPWGDLYPCHQFVGQEEFLMGNVDTGVTRTDIRDEFKLCNVYAKEKCRKCFARFYCSGGCAANSYNFHGCITDAYDIGCEMQKQRIECAIMFKAALALYVGLIVILLSAFEVTLTLPGIAGIILSVGMAVDANVIIFTRIKEELGVGKTVHSAIKTGFNKALSAIVDGNITTLIAAAVLYFRGSGTVKGFATTLAIGIVLSMFTALFVTRGALMALYHLGFDQAKFYGIKKDGRVWNFLGKKKLCFLISIVMVVAGWAAMGLNRTQTGKALNYGMDFTGGTSTNVTFNEDLSLEDISSKVVPVVSKITGDADVQTQKVAGTNEVIIKTKTLNVDQRQALEDAMVENFGVEAEKITAESISGAVSAEMKQDALWAVIVATILMLLYIWFRFKNIKFAASAILALVHDVLVVLTFYAVAKWSVGSTFIACMLTIVGYSINATIVIFDRIRENLAAGRNKETLEELVNKSITQTVTRSINTSLTTFIMVFVLYLMGVSAIREFALPLMVGIVCGTYSSVCVTGALWYVMTTRKKKAAADK